MNAPELLTSIAAASVAISASCVSFLVEWRSRQFERRGLPDDRVFRLSPWCVTFVIAMAFIFLAMSVVEDVKNPDRPVKSFPTAIIIFPLFNGATLFWLARYKAEIVGTMAVLKQGRKKHEPICLDDVQSVHLAYWTIQIKLRSKPKLVYWPLIFGQSGLLLAMLRSRATGS